MVADADQTVLTFRSDDGVNYSSDRDVIASLSKLENGWRLKDKYDLVEEFDTNGKLTLVNTRDGRSHRYSYGESVMTITDDYGRYLEVTMNEAGNPANIRLPDGSVLTYLYSTTQLLETVIYADDTTERFHYNPQGLLTGVTDQRDTRYSTFAYDSDGKAISSEHAGDVDLYSFSYSCLLYTSPSPRDRQKSRMPSSA